MENQDGSSECQRYVELTLGYLEALSRGAQSDEAREMVEDWVYLVKCFQQKFGDE